MYVIPKSKAYQITKARINFLSHAEKWVNSAIEFQIESLEHGKPNLPIEVLNPLLQLLKRFQDTNSDLFYQKILALTCQEMVSFWNNHFIPAPELQIISAFLGAELFVPKEGILCMQALDYFKEKEPGDIRTSISGQTYSRAKLYKQLYQTIMSCFPYEKLKAEKSSKNYTGYNLCQDLELMVCIYCNANYTYTILDWNPPQDKGKSGSKNKRVEQVVRPEIDHFLPQSLFPIFRLTFENLIPACSMCNGKLKHDKIMLPDQYLHPYQNRMPVLTFEKGTGNSIILNVDTNQPDYQKITNTKKLFKTDLVYHHFGNMELAELFEKSDIYDQTYLEEIRPYIEKAGTVDWDKFLKDLFGYISEEKAYNKTLGLARHDLVKEILKMLNVNV